MCHASALFFFSFRCVHQQRHEWLQPKQWGLQQAMALACSLPIQHVTSKQHKHRIKHTHTHTAVQETSTEGSFTSVNCFQLTGFWLLCTETPFWNSRHGVNREMCMEVGRRRSMHTGLKLFLGGIFWELTWNRELNVTLNASEKKIFKTLTTS